LFWLFAVKLEVELYVVNVLFCAGRYLAEVIPDPKDEDNTLDLDGDTP
jgi:hypothetical protein